MDRLEKHSHTADSDSSHELLPAQERHVSSSAEETPISPKEREYQEYIERAYQEAMLELNDSIRERDALKESEKKNEVRELLEEPNEERTSGLMREISSMELERERLSSGSAVPKVGSFIKESVNRLKGVSNAKQVTILQQYIEHNVLEAGRERRGKKIPYHPEKRVLCRLPELLDKACDPITALGRLERAGIIINSYTFQLEYFESLKWFVETPGAIEIMEQLRASGLSLSDTIGSTAHSFSENAQLSVKEVMDNPAARDALLQHGGEFRSFIQETGIRLKANSKSIVALSQALGKQDVKNFCTRYSNQMKSPHNDVASALAKIAELSDKKLLNDAESLEPLVNIKDLFYGVFHNYDQGQVEESIRNLKFVTGDPKARKYLEIVSRIIGKKFHVSFLIDNKDRVESLNPVWKEAIAGFRMGKGENGRPLEFNEYSILQEMAESVVRVKSNAEYKAVLESPYMKDYSDTIAKVHPFVVTRDCRRLGEFFADEKNRTALMTPEGLKLISLFPDDDFLYHYDKYASLLEVENVMEDVPKIQKLFKSKSIHLCVGLSREGILGRTEEFGKMAKLLGRLPGPEVSYYEKMYASMLQRESMLPFIDRFLSYEGHEEYTNWNLETLSTLSDEVLNRPIEEVLGYLCVYSCRTRKFDFLQSENLKARFFEEVYRNPDFQGHFEHDEEKESAVSRTKNIQFALSASEHPELLSPEILKTVTMFEDNYGPKGKTLAMLAVVAYGVEDVSAFNERMNAIASVLDMYNKNNIPKGCRVTFGVEYEVTRGLADEYAKGSCLGYKGDIELVTRAARLGMGRDAVHEIATTPTDNPYVLLAEIKLLQDAGFVDFNFEKYANAARGLHLNLGGESGLYASTDADFLHNVMTMAGLAGAVAGNEVQSVKGVVRNSLSEYFEKTSGDRVEMKGMGGDSVEQFERSILSSYHAGIAMQLAENHLYNYNDTGSTNDFIEHLPRDEESFQEFLEEKKMLVKKFETSQERSILFAWLMLKKDALMAVREHNQSFGDSEFRGYAITPEGEYVDTENHIDAARNQSLLEHIELDSPEFHVSFDIPESLLFAKAHTGLINPLVRVNNLFLKGPVSGPHAVYGKRNKKTVSSVNAAAMLSVMKREGYKLTDDRETAQQSIFDRGGRMRDGYYFVQGASEEMITHKIQIVLNRFNKRVRSLLGEEKRNATNDAPLS